MAIILEYPYKGKENKIKKYSNLRYKILQNETGEKYDLAIDIYPSKYTYTETNEPIETIFPTGENN